GDVPAAALELNRGRRQQFVDGALAAQLADGQRLVRELLDLLEPPAAGVALILVKRHRLYSITSPLSAPSISSRCSQNGAVPCASSVSWNVRSENDLPWCCFKSLRSLRSASLPTLYTR